MLGSLSVHHAATRSPSSSATLVTNDNHASSAPAAAQPPRRVNHVGEVKWWSVTIGAIPRSRRASRTSL